MLRRTLAGYAFQTAQRAEVILAFEEGTEEGREDHIRESYVQERSWDDPGDRFDRWRREDQCVARAGVGGC